MHASIVLCGVAFEHAESAKVLIAAGNFTSALGLVRMQYEALVRAVWVLYAASDEAVTKLMTTFTPERVSVSEKLPMQAEMLKSLEGKAPEAALISLRDFKENAWRPLSSYVHGGIHALHRHGKGYPEQLLKQVLKASNGLLTMVGMLLVILSQDPAHSGKITRIQRDFSDCLPDTKKSDF